MFACHDSLSGLVKDGQKMEGNEQSTQRLYITCAECRMLSVGEGSLSHCITAFMHFCTSHADHDDEQYEVRDI